jgi:hypothetical protein
MNILLLGNDFINKYELKKYLRRTWSVSWPMSLIMLFESLISLTDVDIAGSRAKKNRPPTASSSSPTSSLSLSWLPTR